MELGSQIEQRLARWKPKLMGRHRHDDLIKMIQSCLNPFGVRIKKQFDASLDWQSVAVSGLFDTQKSRRNITILLYFSWGSDWFRINDRNWSELRFQISQCLQHELIHRRQAEYRQHLDNEYTLYYDVKASDSTNKQTMDYLAEIDEIEAYAHDIAMEILEYYPKVDPYQVLRTIAYRKKLWSWVYYKRTFKKSEDWSDVRNRLLKKTYQWLPHIA
jgi:hypothetical protein